MTKEEKLLLFKDLSARLPFGVYVQITYGNAARTRYVFTDKVEKIKFLSNDDNVAVVETQEGYKRYIEYVKPYLRPLEKMTKEEFAELSSIMEYNTNEKPAIEAFCYAMIVGKMPDKKYASLIDFYNSHYFDYRGLIVNGLAYQAPDSLYNETPIQGFQLTPEQIKAIKDGMYDENGWMNIGDGLKMDREGHIAGGIKFKI